ncbi:Solute carrier family 13 member 3 [Liparis tanakae]|uniref:Solute carrier family 13 member 3 n=1 Tax=Liparis tanakae TaxID=230148 RepID=A0A4Z2I7S9_9TELE|nr:Solute carrier family 13 member 3 [Liparis tanakae]
MKLSVVSKKLWCIHKQLILLLVPLLLLPLLFTLPEKEGKCLYVVMLMAMFWCTEALPLAVTAMLPVCLFPTLGILPSKRVCPQYFLETNFLFLSGLVMASSIEDCGLHRRIALKVLTIVGVKPAWLILGMMLTSSFLSMWLSNTATTAMMLPIANAILESLFGDLETLKENAKSTGNIEGDIINGPSPVKMHSLPSVPSEKQMLSIDGTDGSEQIDTRTAEEIRSESEYQLKVWKGFLICIPYAASIGGTATLTGTAPNLIMIGQLKNYFPDCDLINFGSWFAFAFPLMLLFLFLGWIWIAFLHGGLNSRLCFTKHDRRAQAEAKAQALIEDDYRKLGPIKYVSDAVTGVIIVSMLFFFPSQRPSLSWWFDPHVNPLYFMIPATIGCSYAFMLPVSTPPNSIAFASGHLMVKDMVKTGIVMNILGILCVTLAMNTWGVAMFDLNSYPEWANPMNKSAGVTDVHLSLVQSLNATL